MADCQRCQAPQVDTAYICRRCAYRTVEQLRALAELAGELEVTVARLSRVGGGSGSDREPLPLNLGAAYDAWAVQNTIGTWARDIARSRGLVLRIAAPGPLAPLVGPCCRVCGHRSCRGILAGPAPAPAPTPSRQLAALARWLVGQVEWLRHQPDGAQALDELSDACRLGIRIVDLRSPCWYAGPCTAPRVVDADAPLCHPEGGGQPECGADLYAAPGAVAVRCSCGAVYDARDRREWLLGHARDTLAHAELIGRALAALGLPVTPAQVRVWAGRGHIAAHGRDQRSRPTYRVGDVEAVALRMAAARRGRGVAGQAA
jgi:hypothetical protein